jgi:putative DNA primase/helicase
MTWINLSDVEAQLRGAGLMIDKPLSFDSRIQRWKVDGEDHEKRGWSRLKEWTAPATGAVYVVGCYGIWHGNEDGYTKVELPKRDEADRPVLTDADLVAIREAQREAARKVAELRRNEAKQAARWAAQVWAQCPPAPADHEYLVRKRIQPHGARVFTGLGDLRLPGIDESNMWRLQHAVGALVVPMHDEHGNVCGIQFIYPASHPRAAKVGKEFWPGGMAMGGTFGLIGPLRRSGVLLIGEGFATAATLHESTGQSVAYAFAANNLTKAGKQIRKTCKTVRLLYAADDDYMSEGNPGCTAAARATAEIEGSAWTKPDFTGADGQDLRGGKKLSDYNDLHLLTGLPMVVAQQINAKLDALGWRDAESAAVPATQGSGEGASANGRKRALSVMSLDEIVARFVPLDDGTGKYIFDTWTNKVAHRDQMIALLPAGVRGDDIKRHPVWIERGAYYLDQVGFDPSGVDPAVQLNTWKGWPMQPKAGCCDKLLGLLQYLCSGDRNGEELYRWVLKWMAYPLQHPGAKMASAIIMHGPQGTGKSTIWQCLANIYGDYATVLNQRGLEDRFNSDWVDSKLFMLAEEVVTRAEMWHIKNELKELVTGEWIRVNPKNIAAYRQRNQVNAVFLSNENQPLPLENDDRRHCVIYTPPALAEDEYDEVFLEIERGGVAAFYDYLLTLDLGDFHPKKRPPMTDAKQALIALSSPSEQRFVLDWIGGDLGLPIGPALSADVYSAYLRWCRANGESRPRPSNQFAGTIERMSGWVKRKVDVYPDDTYTGSPRRQWVVFPPEHAMQLAGTALPEGHSQTRWVSDSALAFRKAGDDREPWRAAA